MCEHAEANSAVFEFLLRIKATFTEFRPLNCANQYRL